MITNCQYLDSNFVRRDLDLDNTEIVTGCKIHLVEQIVLDEVLNVSNTVLHDLQVNSTYYLIVFHISLFLSFLSLSLSLVMAVIVVMVVIVIRVIMVVMVMTSLSLILSPKVPLLMANLWTCLSLF